MQSNEEVKQRILKRKAQFYYSINLKCHIKIVPTGFVNGKILSEFIEEGGYWNFEDERYPGKLNRLFIDEVFDIKDYEEIIE